MIYTKIYSEINYRVCAKLIKAGEVVAFPTETVYGLAVDASNRKAIDKVYELKKRVRHKALMLHLHCVEQAFECGEINLDAEKLLNSNLSVAVIVKRKQNSKVCILDKESIGMRIVHDRLAQKFLKACACYVYGTSANISSMDSCTSVDKVYEIFKCKISAILNNGTSKYCRESTIISFLNEQPTILREGIVPKNEIEKILDKKLIYENERRT